MSDSDESGITYTEVSNPFEDLSDIGSPRADDHEYLELPGMPEDPYVEASLQAPPSPDYVPGLEEPEQAPPSPDYVPGPEHADDEIVAEDQPGAEDASPTAQSPDYVPESEPEADPEEDDDEDPEEDPVDYSADRGDDGDDEDEPSEEDEDDDVDMEADGDEEEEEHLVPADSVVVALPATDQAPSAEETKPFETDESATAPPPHPAYHVTARISIPAPVPTPLWSDADVARILSISTPPSSPLTPWTKGNAPSLGIPPPLPISVPTSSPPLLLPSASRREDRPEVTLPPRKRLGIALGPGYEVGESSSAAAARPARGLRADYGFVATMDREIRRDPEREIGYGITDSWDEIVETLQGAPVSTDTELGRHMTAFETRVRQDTDEVYTRLDDEQSQRQLLAGRLNMLFRDRRAHAYTRHQMETEARLSREAWRRSMDASDLARGEVMSLRTTKKSQEVSWNAADGTLCHFRSYRVLGLDMSTTHYHPEMMDKAKYHTTLEDMLRDGVIRLWDMVWEALYGESVDRLCGWATSEMLGITGPELVHETTEKIVQIKNRMQAVVIAKVLRECES
ncbi:hypothetical protein Tco_1109067 [Tanacetum coccineum]